MSYLKTPEPSETRKAIKPRKLRAKRTLNGARLPEVITRRKLYRTSLQGVDGHGVVFDDVHGNETLFDNANLAGARFSKGGLLSCSFVGADLSSVLFAGTLITGSNFMHAQLSGACFSYDTFLIAPVFDHAIMHGATVCQAVNGSFRSVNGERMQFQFAKLGSADFTDANLAGSDFTDAWLHGANFTNADLRDVQIWPKQLAMTVGWETARNLHPAMIAATKAIVEKGPIISARPFGPWD